MLVVKAFLHFLKSFTENLTSFLFIPICYEFLDMGAIADRFSGADHIS